MSGLRPSERYFTLANVAGRQRLGLAGHTLLRLYLHRRAQRTRANARQRLHAYRVDRVRRQVGDRRQLAVVHHLRVPRRHWLSRVRRVVDLVTLKRGKKK